MVPQGTSTMKTKRDILTHSRTPMKELEGNTWIHVPTNSSFIWAPTKCTANQSSGTIDFKETIALVHMFCTTPSVCTHFVQHMHMVYMWCTISLANTCCTISMVWMGCTISLVQMCHTISMVYTWSVCQGSHSWRWNRDSRRIVQTELPLWSVTS